MYINKQSSMTYLQLQLSNILYMSFDSRLLSEHALDQPVLVHATVPLTPLFHQPVLLVVQRFLLYLCV